MYAALLDACTSSLAARNVELSLAEIGLFRVDQWHLDPERSWRTPSASPSRRNDLRYPDTMGPATRLQRPLPSPKGERHCEPSITGHTIVWSSTFEVVPCP